MCLSKLFGGDKPQAPAIPAPPPAPSPPPTPTAVESTTTEQDALTKRRKRLRAGLASTIKTGGFNLLGNNNSGTLG